MKKIMLLLAILLLCSAEQIYGDFTTIQFKNVGDETYRINAKTSDGNTYQFEVPKDQTYSMYMPKGVCLKGLTGYKGSNEWLNFKLYNTKSVEVAVDFCGDILISFSFSSKKGRFVGNVSPIIKQSSSSYSSYFKNK